MRGTLSTLATIVAVAVGGAGCASDSAAPESLACTDENGDPLPVAPSSDRIDLDMPSFTTPLAVTNPLNPIGALDRAILLGSTDGFRFRSETTLLPYTKVIEWDGEEFETLVSQYLAFANGRIYEVALDWYAQADDGSVWYLGEDVYNYENGVIVDTDGTWLAGGDGPGGMIMGANPQVGQVWRPENICGLVFEEVTVKSIGVTVDGPSGPVTGAILINELHADATTEDKIFAPGYGEFSTGTGANLEQLALAVPIDALGGGTPAALSTLSNGADQVFDEAGLDDWGAALVTVNSMIFAWSGFSAGPQPPMLAAQMDTTLAALTAAVGAEQPAAARQAAIDVGRTALDFRLRYEARAAIDLEQVNNWTRQLVVDAEANDQAGIVGSIATLKWIRDRIVTDVGPEELNLIDATLRVIRDAAMTGDVARAAAAQEDLEIRVQRAARRVPLRR